MADQWSRVTDCAIGDDSESGLAYECIINGNLHWVPYSVTRKRQINTRSKGCDAIEVQRWWAELNEIESEEI